MAGEQPNDLFLAYKNNSTMHRQIRIERNHESAPSAAPSPIFTTVFESVIGVGFRRYICWIMTDYCTLMNIAPSQLVLRSWGLIHALQVLGDLTGFQISGEMIANAFRLVPVEGNLRRFNLELRDGGSSPVHPPQWLHTNANEDNYFFIIHQGLGVTRHQWSPIGFVPQDVVPAETFPEALFDLDEQFRDTAFLLHPRIVNQTSLNSSPEHPFFPLEGMDNLLPARQMYDFFQEVHEVSPEREDAARANISQDLVLAANSSDLLAEEAFLAREIAASTDRVDQLRARWVQVQVALGRRPPAATRAREEGKSSGSRASASVIPTATETRPISQPIALRSRNPMRRGTRQRDEAGSSRNVRARRST